MPTVLLTSYAGALGGAERALLTFASGLSGERWLACPEGPLASAARGEGLRVAPILSRPLRWRAGASGRIAAATHLAGHRRELGLLIGALRPDLVIANGMRSGIALELIPPRRADLRLVLVHHDLVPPGLAGWAARRTAARAELVVAVSRFVASELDASVRSVVVHPGVDVEWLAGNGTCEPATPPSVLVLGALVAWKRVDVALETVALARTRRPELDLRLVLVGEGLDRDGERLRNELRARADRADLAGAVEFAGWVADPREALHRAWCLLHCAREPFGLALVEALAAGCPVVASDEGGAREIACSSCGVLYAPGDPAAAADAVLSVLENPVRRRELGAAGRRRAAERFGREAAAEAFARSVQLIARRRPAPGRPSAPGRLALVTVTHDCAEDLAALLASAATHLPGVRVVVVDCASSDDAVEVARRSWPGITVELIALDENVGFGTATNRGVASVREQMTALVNPDVELIDDSLLALVDAVLRDGEREPRLYAPSVLRGDGRRQDNVHPLPLSGAALAQALVPAAALAGRPARALAPWRSSTPRRVGWAVGCAIAARTSVLTGLGPFDESIFLYAEDLDLGLRARSAGVETWFWPDASVLHHGGRSTTAAFGSEPFARLAAARHEVIRRRLGRRAAAADAAVQAVTFASRIALKRLAGRDVWREREQLRAVGAIVSR